MNCKAILSRAVGVILRKALICSGCNSSLIFFRPSPKLNFATAADLLPQVIGHQIHSAIVLRKSHDVANALLAADQHDQTIETDRDSAMWRRAEPKRAEQVTKLCLLILSVTPSAANIFSCKSGS